MPDYTPDSLTGPTGTVNEYVIPLSTDYRIDAYGAQGGGINGGKGAHVGGVFSLTIGDKLFIGVGQRPSGVAGGGGCSFVAVGATLATATPILIAAGGGGCSNLAHVDAADGRVPTEPATSVDGADGQGASGTTGGTGGNAPSDAAAASAPAEIGAGGAGWSTGGGASTGRGRYSGALVDDSGGQAIKSGAVGGDSINGSALSGGFGGGGGGHEEGAGVGQACGGGGGYNGGGGGYWTTGSSTHQGGGGGSLNTAATDIANEAGVRSGAGFVTVQPNVVPLAPANVTATPNGTDVDIAWEQPPGDSPWENDNEVVAEIERVDCSGTTQIASIQPGLAGSFTDRFSPLTEPGGNWCGESDHTCSVVYRVRYVGKVATVTIPPASPSIPAGVLMLWDSTEASLPSGWSKDAAFDGTYLRTIPDSTTDPGSTGGSSTHTHTAPAHAHSLNHAHGQGNTPNGTSSASPTPESPPPGTNNTLVTSHSHSVPSTGTASVNSQGTSPSIGSGSSDVVRKELILAESDGTPTGIPQSGLAWTNSGVMAGWEEDASDDPTRPPFIKGAAGDGSSATVADSGHDHSIADHTHAGTSHTHSGGSTNTSGNFYNQTGAGADGVHARATHVHSVSIGSAATAALNSGGAGTSDANTPTNDTDPPWRRLMVQRQLSATPAFPLGLICGWLGALIDIPANWVLCDGTLGTPNLCQGRYLRYRESLATDTGGGDGHDHTTPAHTHTTGGHSHSRSFGQASSGWNWGAPAFFGEYVNRPSRFHTHGSGSTNSATPGVGSATSGTLDEATLEPPYTEIAMILLASVGGTDESVTPFTQWTEWSDTDPLTIENPTPGSLWLRGADEGSIALCSVPGWSRMRPFFAQQAVSGGQPTLVVAEPGGRNYTLTLPVYPGDLATVDAILEENLFWCQPPGEPPVWLAVASETDRALTVASIMELTVACVAVDPEPVDDPEDLLA